MPMPGVFSAINSRIQGSLIGKSLRDISSFLPHGQVVNQEGWVESHIIPDTSVYIKGKYDLLVKNSDGTHTLVDLKLSQAEEDKIEKYKSQLGAYKYALEHPKNDQPVTINRLGLLIFYPDTAVFANGVAQLNFPPTWLDVPIDEKGFLAFIKSVDELLSGPMPQEGIKCKWCKYRHTGDSFSHVA